MMSFDWRLIKKISFRPFILAWLIIILANGLPRWWTGAWWWLDGPSYWVIFIVKIATIFYVAQRLLAAVNGFSQPRVRITTAVSGILQGAVLGLGVGLIQFLFRTNGGTTLVILTNLINLSIAGMVAVYFWFYLIWWQTQRKVIPPDDKKINS